MRRETTLAGLALVVAATACGSKTNDGSASASASASSAKGKVVEAADDTDPAASSTARAAEAAIVQIPAGKFESGSTPGDKGRDPLVEPGLTSLELGAFEIDRSPYPNELDKPPLTGVTRGKAEELCKARGRRLCTELEWERACKGPEGDAFAGRAAWDATCAKTPYCASGYGVLGMGALREIVTGDIAEVKDFVTASPVMRGAAPDAAPPEHRCAKRSRSELSSASSDLGFRCCGGAENAATIPAPVWGQTFTKVDVPASKVADLFSAVPQLRKLGHDIQFFDETTAKGVISRSDVGEVPKGITLTTSPLAWNPVAGENLLVVTGLAGDDAFIVAFFQLPDDRYRVGSTMILHREKGPVVFGFNGYDGKRGKDKSNATLDWATCWKCPAESGVITYKDDGRVTITEE